MKAQDYLGLTLFVGFGLWWVLFPNSVIRFYQWLHRGKVSVRKPLMIRVLGVVWLVMVLGVTLYQSNKFKTAHYRLDESHGLR
jgi:hypothetical protein